MNIVQTKTYTTIDYNLKEILRYSGVAKTTPEINNLIESCIQELDGKLSYKVCYKAFPISSHLTNNNSNTPLLDLGFTTTHSTDLIKNLESCNSIILFGATIGLEIDRLIAKYSSSSPSRALILQAIGAERIESLCNAFNKDISTEQQALGNNTKPRFSPGYGDLDINFQKDIFEALNCSKHIGLTLNESLLMSPSKSVTAIIGVCPS
ncbi:MAG: Vitamin B12 dependent methionine synthase activation subunit [Lachnospiraceae bacterium]|nr:Vitamin B12 dependent methionine synthase activation subunit [Lachnospiraceae bacterium]